MAFSKLLSLALIAAVSVAAPIGPTVTLDFGTFLGVSNPLTGTDTFYGLPFAAPPVGDYRLRPPQPFTTNYGSTVQDATLPKSDCMQQPNAELSDQLINYLGPNYTIYFEPTGTGSEDCLYMNIVRPAGATAGSNLPVMFWIFGGGFELGGISEYDATPIITQSMAMSQDVIWVAANYRLSAWGFLPGQEVQDAGVGNIGLLDQRAALIWVQNYIYQFGGDPTKVTIFGESAGAISIGFQLLLYGGETNNTFRAAIMESGSPIPVGPLSNGQAVYDTVVEYAGCSGATDTLECLRGVSEATFSYAVAQTPYLLDDYRSLDLEYLPRVDYNTVPDLPQNLLREGRYAKVPIISGDNEDEGTLFQFTALNVTTDSEFMSYVAGYFSEMSNTTLEMLMEAYPEDPSQGSPYNTGDLNVLTPENKRIASILGDLTFNGPRRLLSQTYVNASLPIWSYLYTHTSATPVLGAFHASELLSVYGIIPDLISVQMRALWISFTNTLDPNNYGVFGAALGLPYWEQYGTTATQMEFGLVSSSLTTDTYRMAAIDVELDNWSQFTI